MDLGVGLWNQKVLKKHHNNIPWFQNYDETRSMEDVFVNIALDRTLLKRVVGVIWPDSVQNLLTRNHNSALSEL